MTDFERQARWEYQQEHDMWISPDGRTAIDAAIIRQIADARVQNRNGALIQATEEDYERVCEEVVSGKWAA